MTIAEKLTRVAENVPRVHDAGKRAEYDAFWDSFQNNGERTNYELAFAGVGWNNDTLRPKHRIKPTNAFEIFRSCGEVDLTKVGVDIDFSDCTSAGNTFYGSAVTHIGVFDASKLPNLSYCFYRCEHLVEIDEIVVVPTHTFPSTFYRCPALEKIIFSGTVAKDIDIHWSTNLSGASIDSVYWAAYEGYQQGASFTLTLSKTAVERAYSEEDWQRMVDNIGIDIVLL